MAETEKIHETYGDSASTGHKRRRITERRETGYRDKTKTARNIELLNGANACQKHIAMYALLHHGGGLRWGTQTWTGTGTWASGGGSESQATDNHKAESPA